MKRYQTIIFDMGNVLIDFDPLRIVSHFTQDKTEIALVTEAIFQHKEWSLLDLGMIDDEEAIRGICQRVPKELHGLVETIITQWYVTNLVYEDMVPLVRQLKAKGYGLYLASNASLHFYDYYHDIKALDHFDGLLISADIHLAKPDRAFFETLLKRFDLDADTCFMIDDLSRNITGAAACGIDGSVYDGNIETLRATLIDKQIL